MPVTSFSTTAANNNSASPNGAPEGMAPSGVNDVIRQVMADIAREAQINAVKKLNSVAGTDTITADMDPELASYAAGMLVVITPAATNTAAVTLAIDGLTALDVLKADGDALAAGDLVIGVPALLLLDSGADDWYLLNPQTPQFTEASGSFTGTSTGHTVAQTGTCYYSKNGNTVTLALPFMTGTSNAVTFTITGLPAAIVGTRNQFFRQRVVDSSVDGNSPGDGIMVGGSSTITVYKAFSSASFTASGIKALGDATQTPFTVTYVLN